MNTSITPQPQSIQAPWPAPRGWVFLLLLMSIPRPALADPPEGRWIEHCAPDSAAHGTAWAHFTAFDEHLSMVEHGTPLAETQRRFSALLTHPCFEMAQLEAPSLDKVHSLWAFRTWWHDGGRDWIRSYMAYAPTPTYKDGKEGDAHWTVIPPTARRVLTREANPEHALFPLLCSQSDPHCGLVVDSWRRRVDAALFDAIPAYRANDPDAVVAQAEQVSGKTCMAHVAKTPADVRYRHWRQCVRDMGRQPQAVPLGRFRVPRTGWLVTVESNGYHSNTCARTRLYDLETGSIYGYTLCDCLKTRFTRCVRPAEGSQEKRLLTGSVPVETLREALWMLAVLPHLDTAVQTRSRKVFLPDTMEPRWLDTASPAMGFGLGIGGGGTSHSVKFSWAWLQGEQITLQGTLRLTPYLTPHQVYALELLSLAHDARRPGCPQAAVSQAATQAPAIKAFPHLADPLRAAVAAWRKSTACPLPVVGQ